MSSKLIVLEWSFYDSSIQRTLVRGHIVADTLADLPASVDAYTNYRLTIGTTAKVIATGDDYMMQSGGTWSIQPKSGGGVDAYTKAEVDQLIQDTKDYADGEIVGAINDLDVAAVGGTTRYIYSISQADGKISASAYTSDSSPTPGSTKLVQSGGVKTYVDTEVQALEDNVPAMSETQVYGQGTRIPADSNLNDYWTAGSFHILTADNARSILNKPNDPDFDTGSVRARVLVFQFSGTTVDAARCFQVYIPARTNSSTGTGCYYIRYRYISNNVPGWTGWYRIDGTLLT